MSEPTFLEGVTPILRVCDLDRSLAHYVEVLGFHLDWRGPFMGSVSRDRCHLMLCENDQGHAGTWVWVGTADAGALHAELATRGATIRLGPTNFPWAREFHVQDPDGHVLRFGSEPHADEPYSEWVAWYRD